MTRHTPRLFLVTSALFLAIVLVAGPGGRAAFAQSGSDQSQQADASFDELVRQARAAADKADHANAIMLFRRATELDPRRAKEILRELADQLAFSGDPAAAVPIYRDLLDSGGVAEAEREKARRNLAQALIWSGAVNEAVAAWQKIYDANPGDTEAQRGLSEALIAAARAAANRGANAESATLFRKAREIDPTAGNAVAREYADQLAYSGRAQSAIPIYRDALASPSLTSEERQRIQRGLAFALLWSGDYEAAIRAMETVSAAMPGDPDLRNGLADALVGAARETAGRNRNARSAEFFARALQVAPERRGKLLREYADQLLYSGANAKAETQYREILMWPGLAPDARRDARLGLARSLAWSGNHRAAIDEYDLILRDRIDDVEALIGRGESRNAIARHRDALSDFERALIQEPNREQAVRGAAQAELSLGYPRRAWARVRRFVEMGEAHKDTLLVAAYAKKDIGRPDQAEDIVQALLIRDPANAAGRDLLEQIRENQRPSSTATAQYVDQSDGLTIASAETTTTFTSNRGLTTISPEAQLTSYGGGDFPDVTVTSLGIRASHRINDFIDIDGGLWLNFEDEGSHGDDIEALYEANVNYTPDDTWRYGASAARLTPDDSKSIVNDITFDEFGLRVEYSPGRDVYAFARGTFSDYSDGNTRWWTHAAVAGRVHEGPDLWLGIRGTAFFFQSELDNGYWNPKSYASAEATAHTYGRLWERFRYDFQGSLGYEWSDPDGQRPIWSVALLLGYDLNPALAFEVYGSYQQSGAGGGGTGDRSDGFSRSVVRGRMLYRW